MMVRMMEDHHTGGEQEARPDLEHWNTLGIGTVFRDDMRKSKQSK